MTGRMSLTLASTVTKEGNYFDAISHKAKVCIEPAKNRAALSFTVADSNLNVVILNQSLNIYVLFIKEMIFELSRSY